MFHTSSLVITALATTLAAVGAGRTPSAFQAERVDKKPALSVKASPAVSFAPSRVVLQADVRGGPNDYEEYYCATVEWDWGDGTKSEASYDCEPYEAGKSEIRRRYSIEHVYRQAGSFRVQFSLKQDRRIVAAANTTIQVRPGIRDPGDD